MNLFNIVIAIIIIEIIIIASYHIYTTHSYRKRIALVESDFQALLTEFNHDLSADQIWGFCEDNDDIIDDIDYHFDDNNNAVYTLIYREKLA